MADEDQAATIAELKNENEQLREELSNRDRRQGQIARGALGAGGRLLLGPDLRSSFRDWIKAKSLRDPLPADETAGVLAAVVRRVVRVGFYGVVLAVLPGAFLVWQNLLIRSQIQLQADQIEQQAADTLIVRRAQLLATIYEEDCEEVRASEAPERGGQEAGDSPATERRACQPQAHARARQEAVLAFLKIERSRGVRVDLTGANLARLKLPYANLANTNLFRANLTDTTLWYANLSSANLAHANLTGAKLSDANLSTASLVDANLSRANLVAAELSRANLVGANLSYANLSAAEGLSQEKIRLAKGTAATKLPPGLTRPSHWKTAPQSEADPRYGCGDTRTP